MNSAGAFDRRKDVTMTMLQTIYTTLFALVLVAGPTGTAEAGNGPAPATSASAATRSNPRASTRVAQGKRARPNRRKAGAGKRQKVRQRIRALRAWRLTEALDLDETTAGRLFPILNKYDDQFAKAMREGGQLRRKLRQQMRPRTPNAKVINPLIDKMLAQQRTMWRLQDARFKEVRRVLTAPQAAKILIVLPEIDRQIHRQIRRAMNGRRGRGNRGGGMNPFDAPTRRDAAPDGHKKDPFRGKRRRRSPRSEPIDPF